MLPLACLSGLVPNASQADGRQMNVSWLGERVAAPDVNLLARNVILNKVAGNWGPTQSFASLRTAALGGSGLPSPKRCRLTTHDSASIVA